MSQSPARKARRQCKRNGSHWANTNDGSAFWCGICGVALDQQGNVLPSGSVAS